LFKELNPFAEVNMVGTIQVAYERKQKDGHEIHRAKIRFAPGPCGIVFTKWYMGAKGPPLTVKQFISAFGCGIANVKTL